MKQMICNRPPIERTANNTRLVRALLRAKYAKTANPGLKGQQEFDGLIFDWQTIKWDVESGDFKIVKIGEVAVRQLQDWILECEVNYPDVFQTPYTGERHFRNATPQPALQILEIEIVDPNRMLAQALESEFKSYAEVHTVCASVFTTTADTIAFPSHSFGIMDEGPGANMGSFLGEGVETGIRQKISQQFDGEVPIGCALTVNVEHSRFRRVIIAPIMRVPQNTAHTINVYLAMKAILREALKFESIHSIAIAGLYSPTGGMPETQVARQMRIAYEKVMRGMYAYIHWKEEREFEEYLRGEILSPPNLNRLGRVVK
jgi:O-acetyl-ADP-ribose deacetylase (regulator of RNase III)